MTFHSLSYFLFLPVVYLLFHFCPDRRRWLVLLASSYAFYASLQAWYLPVLLLAVTAVSYACALRIAAQTEEAGRRRWLWIGIAACIGVLALLKYLPFLASSAESLLGLHRNLAAALIGIGVSYFSLQAVSYLADVYLELEEPERHFGHYALYLAFFPKLLQGPIERAGELLPQLKAPYRFDYDAMRSGLLLFACGLFKKVVLADRLALYADQVYNDVQHFTGPGLVLGTYAYALQIYFDFSGYTDMARGTGRLFGVKLTENFNAPYLATSIADFWRRWHISFSRFILDYIFKPLQMGWRDRGQSGSAAALLVTFLVSGIWHGASWGFVIWGLLHGLYLAGSTYYRPYQKRLHDRLGVGRSRWLKWWQALVTFNLVSFAWVFFRANGLGDARYVIGAIFDWSGYLAFREIGWNQYIRQNITLELGRVEFIVTASLLLIVLMLRKVNRDTVLDMPVWFRWISYSGILVAVLFLRMPGSKFIYFKF